MDNPNQPMENQTENQNTPRSFGSQFLAITNAKWFLVSLVLVACVGLYAISARSRGLWPFPALEEKVVLTPTPSSTFTPLPDPMASWQTYRNEEYGFEFKYPSDWAYDYNDTTEYALYTAYFDKIDPATGKREFSEGTGGFGFYVIDKSANDAYISIRSSCQTYSSEFNAPDPIFSYKEIVFAGKDGWEVSCNSTYGGPYTVTILPITASKTLEINSGYEFALHNQILSTFKFIEPTPADSGVTCIQVITPARNPQTGEVKDFPTPCDVPEGWEVIK